MKDEWWYATSGTRKGPVTFEFLRGKVLDGSLTASNLVWTETMSAWAPLSEVPALHQFIRALPPELPLSPAPWRRFSARCIDLLVIVPPTVFAVFLFLRSFFRALYSGFSNQMLISFLGFSSHR